MSTWFKETELFELTLVNMTKLAKYFFNITVHLLQLFKVKQKWMFFQRSLEFQIDVLLNGPCLGRTCTMVITLWQSIWNWNSNDLWKMIHFCFTVYTFSPNMGHLIIRLSETPVIFGKSFIFALLCTRSPQTWPWAI